MPWLAAASKPFPDILSIITSVTVIAAVIGGVVTLVVALINNRVTTHKDRVQLHRELTIEALTELRSIMREMDQIGVPVDPVSGKDDFAAYHNSVLPILSDLSFRLRKVAMLPYVIGNDELVGHITAYRKHINDFLGMHGYSVRPGSIHPPSPPTSPPSGGCARTLSPVGAPSWTD